MFLWSARTLANAVREHLPETAPLLWRPSPPPTAHRTRRGLREAYPKCENISAITRCWSRARPRGEHLSHLYCIPAEFTWTISALGSLYEYQLETRLRGDARAT